MDIHTRFVALYQRATAQPVIALAWVTFVVVAFLNPAKIGVLVYGVCKLALFAHAGNWVDCHRFPNDQPENLVGIEQGTAWKRKSWIICAAILAGALAP
ncbi:MAG: putative holin [Xanthomonadaceae bacterium]|nr:putative holin [Xanthomonadaceae bacterium]MDP2185040.1 putative holin [Xanthomonadales bacterium]MDZ4114419.1 putative holin [Xanthomonadaceae bacterium]